MSDENNNENKKRIELWGGYWVDFDENLADDFDFATDLQIAVKNQDIAGVTELYFALVGGEKTYEDMRKHLIETEGRFSTESVLEIIGKIDNAFPKVGNRAQRRSWKASR